MPKKSPTVCNISVKHLRKRGINNFKEWCKIKNTLYIGRNMQYYVDGTTKSKWCNIFSVKKYGRDKCLNMYQEYIINSDLYNSLHELEGKELGCWCKPNECHGDVLIELFDHVFNNNN